MQFAAKAPWRKAQVQSSENANVSCSPPPGLENLRGVQVEIPASPPGLEDFLIPPPGLLRESSACSSTSSATVTKASTSIPDTPEAQQEYKILLQNLPQCVLNNSMVRAFVKELGIKDVKKLSFKPDGRALIVVTNYDAVQHCLALFPDNSSRLPWFYGSMLPERRIIATELKSFKSNTSSLSADAPCFVPSSLGCGTNVRDNSIAIASPASKANVHGGSFLSVASTDSGSLESASDSSDSEAE